MKTLLNVIWLVLAGLWLALGYVVAGIVCCLLVVTIPFGIVSFRIAGYALWPFGRTVVDKPTVGAWSTIGNVIWLVVAGIWLAIGHVLTAIPLFLSQKDKAEETAAKNDVRNAATYAETYAVDNGGSYAGFEVAGVLAGLGFKASDKVAVSVKSASAGGFCIDGKHANAAQAWKYDSAATPQLAKGTCP